jgi:hypothetical protein
MWNNFLNNAKNCRPDPQTSRRMSPSNTSARNPRFITARYFMMAVLIPQSPRLRYKSMVKRCVCVRAFGGSLFIPSEFVKLTM